MRSVLHAGFSIALSEYCLQRELPHPGFVALDTPVLTYRDADEAAVETTAQETADDELLSGAVARAFYEYLASDHAGQTMVLENQTPPPVEAAGCVVVYFSGSPTTGRVGFYPIAEAPTSD